MEVCSERGSPQLKSREPGSGSVSATNVSCELPTCPMEAWSNGGWYSKRRSHGAPDHIVPAHCGGGLLFPQCQGRSQSPSLWILAVTLLPPPGVSAHNPGASYRERKQTLLLCCILPMHYIPSPTPNLRETMRRFLPLMWEFC